MLTEKRRVILTKTLVDKTGYLIHSLYVAHTRILGSYLVVQE